MKKYVKVLVNQLDVVAEFHYCLNSTACEVILIGEGFMDTFVKITHVVDDKYIISQFFRAKDVVEISEYVKET